LILDQSEKVVVLALCDRTEMTVVDKVAEVHRAELLVEKAISRRVSAST
jgi:hypothetical protein